MRVQRTEPIRSLQGRGREIDGEPLVRMRRQPFRGEFQHARIEQRHQPGPLHRGHDLGTGEEGHVRAFQPCEGLAENRLPRARIDHRLACKDQPALVERIDHRVGRELRGGAQARLAFEIMDHHRLVRLVARTGKRILGAPNQRRVASRGMIGGTGRPDSQTDGEGPVRGHDRCFTDDVTQSLCGDRRLCGGT